MPSVHAGKRIVSASFRSCSKAVVCRPEKSVLLVQNAPPVDFPQGLMAIAVRPSYVSALSPCGTGTCKDSLPENAWLPEKAFSGVFALQKRRNPFSFSDFSLRVRVMAIISTVLEPILVLFFSARTLLSRE